jgi:hypothetical protein
VQSGWQQGKKVENEKVERAIKEQKEKESHAESV